MSNLTKTQKIGIFTTFVAITIVGSIVTFTGNSALGLKISNDVSQAIKQSQFTNQYAKCVSGNLTLASCNNLGSMFSNNSGNLVAGLQ